jgi:hypothetical protein
MRRSRLAEGGLRLQPPGATLREIHDRHSAAAWISILGEPPSIGRWPDLAARQSYWEGVTTVVLFGGGGSLLLKDTHPANTRGSSNAIKARRIGFPFSDPIQV